MLSIIAMCIFVLVAIPSATGAEEIALRDYLVLPRTGEYGRRPVFRDPLEHSRVVGTWKPPSAGDLVTSVDGRAVKWRAIQAKHDGSITDNALEGGYAFANVSVAADHVMILEAVGHSMVFVNGEPRAGDPYSTGFVRLPVLLRQGQNSLLFHCTRGHLRAKLTAPIKPVYVDVGDLTATNSGMPSGPMAGVVVVNATQEPIRPIVSGTRGLKRREDRFRIPALSLRKVPIASFQTLQDGSKPAVVVLGDNTIHDSVELSVRSPEPGQTYTVGFQSAIDDSVQYYAVKPAVPTRKTGRRRVLVLSLHGAGVEANGQADSYSAKPELDIVCPTNRRPFGFDWEDWGRLDALEVLEHSTARLRPDASRIYLTGHSMGGHGTWSLGSLFPDRFAALGPSAGWLSFSTYSDSVPSPPHSLVERLLARAATPSDPTTYFTNLKHQGIYILHGADDDNVPVDQARAMVRHLHDFHSDFVYHEQAAVGHWWDLSDEPGADCVDWADLFDFFAHRRLPRPIELRELEFTTPSPGISSRCHWLAIETQARAFAPSSVHIRVEPIQRRYSAETINVQRLRMDLVHLSGPDPIRLKLDRQELSDVAWPAAGILSLERRAGQWHVAQNLAPSMKSPARCGPLKEAFRNRMIFVHGTRGTDEEDQWALAKARFDAETWWYRANGSVDVIPDVEFDVRAQADRNVILYGNADTLSCWSALLGESPVRIGRGVVRIGSRQEKRNDLACLFIYPRRDSDVASIAVIGGSGIEGMRLTDRLPVFVSGVAYPDVLLLDPSVLQEGMRGVQCAGFFGNDWSVEKGEFEWTE